MQLRSFLTPTPKEMQDFSELRVCLSGMSSCFPICVMLLVEEEAGSSRIRYEVCILWHLDVFCNESCLSHPPIIYIPYKSRWKSSLWAWIG